VKYHKIFSYLDKLLFTVLIDTAVFRVTEFVGLPDSCCRSGLLLLGEQAILVFLKERARGCGGGSLHAVDTHRGQVASQLIPTRLGGGGLRAHTAHVGRVSLVQVRVVIVCGCGGGSGVEVICNEGNNRVLPR